MPPDPLTDRPSTVNPTAGQAYQLPKDPSNDFGTAPPSVAELSGYASASMALAAQLRKYFGPTATCIALCSCRGNAAPNYPQLVIQPLGVLLDTGEGYRQTVIEGQANEQNDRFSLPLPGAAIELWSGNQLLATTHADLNGHFVFSKTLLNGEYMVKAAACPSAQAKLAVLRERRLAIALNFPQLCAPAQN